MYFLRISDDPEREALRKFQEVSETIWFDSYAEAIKANQTDKPIPKFCPIILKYAINYSAITGWRIENQEIFSQLLSQYLGKEPLCILFSQTYSKLEDNLYALEDIILIQVEDLATISFDSLLEE